MLPINVLSERQDDSQLPSDYADMRSVDVMHIPGPQAERLSNGDYLYVYNIDTGFPYKPNPLGRCAIGWAVLDGNDPTQIIARSEDALLVASEPWEVSVFLSPPKKKLKKHLLYCDGSSCNTL